MQSRCSPRCLALLAMMLVGLLPSKSAAYEREAVADSPGTFLYWATRVITYTINRRGSADLPLGDVTGAIKRAFFSWASPSCTDVYFHFGGYDATETTNLQLAQNEAPDRKNVIIWHEDSWPPKGATDPSLNEKIPAITTLIYDPKTGVVADADIDLNGYNFFWTTTDDATKAAMDLESVIAHEAGHLLGLAHSKEQESTMYANVAQSELKKRTLEKDDIAGVCFVYPFNGNTPPGPGQGTVKNEVQGGCAVGAAARSCYGGLCALLGPLLLLFLAARLWVSRRENHIP